LGIFADLKKSWFRISSRVGLELGSPIRILEMRSFAASDI